MTRWLLPSLLLGSWALLISPCLAQEELPTSPPAALSPEACQPVAERTFPGKEVYLMEVQSATTIQKMVPREVEVAREQRPDLEITWKEEKQVRTVLVMKSHEVEQEVACTTMEKVATVNPHTGHACTTYQAVPVVKKVKLTVYEAVPEQQEFVVRVPVLRRTEKEVVVKQLVIDTTTEAAIEKRLQAIPVPYEIKVPVTPLPCLH